jgi:hypothetical protein
MGGLHCHRKFTTDVIRDPPKQWTCSAIREIVYNERDGQGCRPEQNYRVRDIEITSNDRNLRCRH